MTATTARPAETKKPRGMSPQDVYELTGVADPRISADGRLVAYTVYGVDKDANEYRRAIWVAPLDGSEEPRRFTWGDKQDGDPRWSPDGTQLAFSSRVRDAAYDEEDDKKRAPRRFRRLMYKLDSEGWTGDRRRQIFVVRA